MLENIALWLGVSPQTIKDHSLLLAEAPRLNNKLDLKVIGPGEAVLRKGFQVVLSRCSEKVRYLITDSLKKWRQLIRKDLVEIDQCAFVDVYITLLKALNLKPMDWNGYKACVCLSHDVDSSEGYKFIADLISLENKFGVKSTFNFLTDWGYKIERTLLRDLTSDGFEIGLHGFRHDIAFGLSPEWKIRDQLRRSLDILGVQVKGFRAPAFSITRRLLKILVELGIKYDSSMKTLSCYGAGVETCYPYRYPGIEIWEVPLTFQDDRIFRDLHLSNEEGLGVIKEISSGISDVFGVTVINTHPRLLKRRLGFYEKLLSWLSSMDNMWICPMGEMIDFMEKRRIEWQKISS